jgi:hypothetical protein
MRIPMQQGAVLQCHCRRKADSESPSRPIGWWAFSLESWMRTLGLTVNYLLGLVRR